MSGAAGTSTAIGARHRVEAWALDAWLWLTRRLSFARASALGGWLARRIGPALPVHRTARANLEAAFPEKSAAEIGAILNAMWDNLGRVAGEWAGLAALDTTDPNGRVEVLGLAHMLDAQAAGKGFIIFAAHQANWELATLVAAQRGVALATVYRAIANPLIDARVRAERSRFHGSLIPKGRDGAFAMLKALRKGEPVGLLIDQKLNEGEPIPFFGRPAMTLTAPAELALRLGCPLIPVRLERLDGARFRVTIHPPMELPDTGDRRADTRAVLTAMNALLEDWVRARPGQWFWVHKRWPAEGA